MHEWHSFLFRIMPYIPGLAGTDYITKFAAEQLQEKVRETEKGGKGDAGCGDFLTRLWDMHVKDPERISQSDLMVMCFTNIGAGSDTTSISLAAILYHVYKDRTCLKKVGEFPLSKYPYDERY
jgi:cytochrome P450